MGTPRTLHGAMRRGWFPVEITLESRKKKDVSDLGLCIWADRNCRGKWVHEYVVSRDCMSAFVFEDGVDAFWFSARWS